MQRTCPTRPVKTVADIWDSSELLKSNLSMLLVLHTCGLARHCSLGCRSYCARGPELLESNVSKLLVLRTCEMDQGY